MLYVTENDIFLYSQNVYFLFRLETNRKRFEHSIVTVNAGENVNFVKTKFMYIRENYLIQAKGMKIRKNRKSQGETLKSSEQWKIRKSS